MSAPARKLLSATLLIVMALLSGAVTAETSFSRIDFFGDSLSDSGNAFIVLGTLSVPPFEPIPSAPYARGGRHFSNGRTWAEQFAGQLGMSRSAKAAFRVPRRFTNYAVGGSRARLEGDINLTTQVGLYLEDFSTASADDLYVIVIGGNDIRDALVALEGDPSGVTSAAIITEAITSIATNISVLTAMGARQFMVGNVPDLGLAPAVRVQGPVAQFFATLLSEQFNLALETTLAGLESTLPVTIKWLDLFGVIRDAVADPTAFGLAEVEVPCLTFGTLVGVFCEQPDRYLFWDGIHPTKAGHALLAAEALQVSN